MDDADISDERIQRAIDSKLSEVRLQKALMPAGSPGECERCGEWSGRLVGGACAPCRDKYGLK